MSVRRLNSVDAYDLMDELDEADDHIRELKAFIAKYHGEHYDDCPQSRNSPEHFIGPCVCGKDEADALLSPCSESQSMGHDQCGCLCHFHGYGSGYCNFCRPCDSCASEHKHE